MLHSGAESDPLNLPELCLYGMITFSSLLMAYIAVFFAYQVDLGARVLQAWKKVLGQPPGEEEHLLHTLPYYLAVTRSSCEVRTLWGSDQIFWGSSTFMQWENCHIMKRLSIRIPGSHLKSACWTKNLHQSQELSNVGRGQTSAWCQKSKVEICGE